MNYFSIFSSQFVRTKQNSLKCSKGTNILKIYFKKIVFVLCSLSINASLEQKVKIFENRGKKAKKWKTQALLRVYDLKLKRGEREEKSEEIALIRKVIGNSNSVRVEEMVSLAKIFREEFFNVI